MHIVFDIVLCGFYGRGEPRTTFWGVTPGYISQVMGYPGKKEQMHNIKLCTYGV